MQSNSITLAVDKLNNGSPENEVFSRLEELVNRSTYRGPDHALQARNVMQLYRTLPKRSGNFLGAAKVEVKFTADITVNGADGSDVTAPAIATVSFSLPVGQTSADKKALRQRVIAMLDKDTEMDLLMDYQEI